MFDIKSLQADSGDKIVSIGWSYTTADGSRSGTIKLPEPYGDIPLDSITKETLLNWVDTLLPDNIEESLDAQIVPDNARAQIREVAVPD